MTQLEILNEFFKVLKEEIIVNYDKLGLRASGKFANELDSTIDTSSKLNGKIVGASYTKQLVEGRRAGLGEEGSLKYAIRQWIDDKRIVPKGNITKDSLAFLISRKIHREGIKVPNQYNSGTLLTDVITDSKINGLIDKLKGYYLFRAKSELTKILKEVA